MSESQDDIRIFNGPRRLEKAMHMLEGIVRGVTLDKRLNEQSTAGNHKPRALRCARRGVPNAAERLGQRADADPLHFGGVGKARANGVNVGIDQAGNNCTAAEIDDASGGTGQRANVRGTADCRDPAVSHRERRGGRSVGANDLAVDEDGVGGLGVSRQNCREQRQQAQHRAADAA